MSVMELVTDRRSAVSEVDFPHAVVGGRNRLGGRVIIGSIDRIRLALAERKSFKSAGLRALAFLSHIDDFLIIPQKAIMIQ